MGPNVTTGAPPEAALVSVWRAYGPQLRQRCLVWMGGRRDEADEAFSRAGLLALQKYPGQRRQVLNPRSWLLKLTYHVCMDLHRERGRRREHSLGTLVETWPESVERPDSSPAADPEACYLAGELEDRLRQWVEELPPRLRSATALHVVQEVPYREVAPALGISEANARKRVQEARAILRGRLREYLGPLRWSPARASSRAALRIRR